VTFINPEMTVTLAVAAARTQRVTIFGNLWVPMLHEPAMLAKQIATLDLVSDGRVVVALGVGGRPHDYTAAGAAFARRHERLDEIVAELRSLWSGTPPFEGADPVGPAMSTPGGPPILSGAMGPKAIARAALWADGISGFSLGDVGRESATMNALATAAWEAAGRTEAPRLINGTFCVLGVDEPQAVLEKFATTYLGFFGDELASALAKGCRVSTQEALLEALDEAEEAGCEEFIVVPGTWDLGCLQAISDVVAARA
jgi:alkanesulfonate monooxygenase SsuD/methylene tetrahydromethanopterin reductase-like flavin-dependent oxidoreductase (luciferase family)